MGMYKTQRYETRGQSIVYLLYEGEEIVGMLEKFRDTRTEHHPWKAFLGWGMSRRYLGAFYAERAGWPAQPGGGRPAALAAVRLAREAVAV